MVPALSKAWNVLEKNISDMEKNTITFAQNVLLLDVTCINETVYGAKRFLGERLGRKLPDTNLVDWLICLGLDAGLRGEENEVQVLLVADEDAHWLKECEPADLSELDGNACRTSLGEYAFSVVPSAGMVSRAALFNELVQLALDAKEVERLMVVPRFSEYGQELAKTFHDFCEDKELDQADKALCFLMEEPEGVLRCRTDLATYSLLHIWGVSPEDL